jgi:diketogulonate reductase-like aldo/keto reductase
VATQSRSNYESCVVLADGNSMPMVALGTWQVPEGDECVNAVRTALESGYRHIDTAQAYGNERSVGEGLRQSGVPRDQVFVTTKFYPGNGDPVSALRGSLDLLGVDRVDLYLVHWPQGDTERAWHGMEVSQDRALTRSIGVSNFDVRDLKAVLAMARRNPVVNQVQFSPFEFRRVLLDFAKEEGIILEAYSPLGTGQHLADARVQLMASRAGRSPAQVLLRWCVQNGVPVVSKSTKIDRIRENLAVADFCLTPDAMREFESLDRTGGTDRAREDRWW